MTRTSARVPVDLTSPGQVFACLGFIEVAEVLCGGVEAHFELSDKPHFVISACGGNDPINAVIAFLASATIRELIPSSTTLGESEADAEEESGGHEKDDDLPAATETRPGREGLVFPTGRPEPTAYPLRLEKDDVWLDVSHWADGSSRDTFKLYSGNRSAAGIARAMQLGTRQKATKNQTEGDLATEGVAQLWEHERERMAQDPFSVLTPLPGTFNFDPRKGWTALDAGYSPNAQSHEVESSPLVELLAPIGLEHVRPCSVGNRQFRYAVWGVRLPAILARVAFQGSLPGVPSRAFRFALSLSGKNKNVTVSTEETG